MEINIAIIGSASSDAKSCITSRLKKNMELKTTTTKLVAVPIKLRGKIISTHQIPVNQVYTITNGNQQNNNTIRTPETPKIIFHNIDSGLNMGKIERTIFIYNKLRYIDGIIMINDLSELNTANKIANYYNTIKDVQSIVPILDISNENAILNKNIKSLYEIHMKQLKMKYSYYNKINIDVTNNTNMNLVFQNILKMVYKSEQINVSDVIIK